MFYGLIPIVLGLLGLVATFTAWDRGYLRRPGLSRVLTLGAGGLIWLGLVMTAVALIEPADAAEISAGPTMFGSTVDEVIFRILVIDALLILAMGVITAGAMVFDVKPKGIWERLPIAAVFLVLSTLGCAAVLAFGRFLAGF